MFSSSQRLLSALLATFVCFLLVYQFALSKNASFFKLSHNSSSPSIKPVANNLTQKNALPAPIHPLPLQDALPDGALEGGPRLRQCTTILPGEDHPQFERALRTHLRHGQKWGYPTDVLRDFLVQDKYYNKPAYTIYLIYNELTKPKGMRAEWL